MNELTPLPEPRPNGLSVRAGRRGRWRLWWPVVVAAFCYFACSELGLALWLRQTHSPALAMTLGLYMGVVMALPRRRLALIGVLFVAAVVSQIILHHIPWRLCVGYFASQTLTVLAVTAWLRWWRKSPSSLETVSGVLLFAASTAVVCAVLVAPLGAFANARLYGDPFLAAWVYWLFPSLTAMWLIAPPIATAAVTRGRLHGPLDSRRSIEAALLFGTLAFAVIGDFNARLSFLSVPTVQLLWAIWAVLRFGSPGAGLAMLIICLGYVGSTASGVGPFIRPDRRLDESMMRALAYLGLWSAFFQIVAAVLSEKARAVEGLATLNRELERRVADRTISLIQASEALQETESRLGLATKAAHAGTFDWDTRSDTNYWSDELLALYGFTREEFGAHYRSWVDIIHPEDRARATGAVEQALRTGQYATEFRIFRRDTGELRWMEARGTVMFNEQREPQRLLGINVDVTEQKRAELAVLENTARKSALLELTHAILTKPAGLKQLGDMVFAKIAPVLDADVGFNFRYLPENGRLELVASVGVPSEVTEKLQRLELNDAFRGASAASQTVVAVSHVEGPGAEASALTRIVGSRAYVCQPLLSSDGGLLGTLAFASSKRDAFAATEIDFLQTLCHVVAMAWERFSAEEAMRRAKEAAEQASRAKDDFLAALSHELRTPLNPVLLLASEMEQREDLLPELRDDLALMRRNIELEARLIDDLLDLTRITRGKVSLDLQPVSVHRVLRAALEILRGDFEHHRLQLTLALVEGADTVQADSVRLQQVFWNILRNAIKYTPDGGSVTVRSQLKDESIEVAIADSGAGIEPRNLEKIFDAFHQEEGRHRFGGLGLGLAIARSLVQLQHGTIRASSGGSNRGATFTVCLPLRQGDLTLSVLNGTPASGESVPAESPSGLRILLVEDHEPTRNVLVRLLERRRHRVRVAETLAGARDLAAAEEFDLLISDLGLPDGDGAELMSDFLAKGGPPGIAISGYGMDEDLQRTTRAGFFAHLVKPVDMGLLDRTLTAMVEQGKMLGRN